jgi:hypothetical protein
MQYSLGLNKPDHRKRKDPRILHEILYDEAKAGKITNQTFKDAAITHLKAAPLSMAQVGTDGFKRFPCSVSGDTYYTKKARSIIDHKSELVFNKQGTIVFATLTVDIRSLGFNYYKAGIEAKKQLRKYIASVSERLNYYYGQAKSKRNFNYIWVLEYQHSGNPHYHIIFNLLDRYPFTYKKKLKGKYHKDGSPVTVNKLSSRKLQDCFTLPWTLGNADVTVLDGEAAQGYLTKYIGKGLKLDKDLLEMPAEQFTDEQRKALLQMMMPVLCNARRFDYSHRLEPSKRSRKERVKEIADKIAETVITETPKRRRRLRTW